MRQEGAAVVAHLHQNNGTARGELDRCLNAAQMQHGRWVRYRYCGITPH